MVAIIGISIAFYETQVNFPWKNSQVWNFNSYPVNTIPTNFAAFETDPTPGLWVVKTDDTAPFPPNVLAKLPGNNDTMQYHLQIIPDSPNSNFEEVTVKFKIISGQEAQAAGLVLRFVDNDHYFVLMADAMNNRISLCKDEPGYLVCNYERLTPISIGQWHTMSANVSPEGIAGFLDNQLLIRANNEAYQTGQVGFWTKGDTEAYFDDLEISY
jgi:hypothetical protein